MYVDIYTTLTVLALLVAPYIYDISGLRVKQMNILASAGNRITFPRVLDSILVTTSHRYCIYAYVTIFRINSNYFLKNQ